MSVNCMGREFDSSYISIHRTLEVGQVTLLVERGALETERSNDVVDLDLGVVKLLSTLLGGGVGTDI